MSTPEAISGEFKVRSLKASATDVSITKMKKIALPFILAIAIPVHTSAEELLFLGTKYAKANGYMAQSRTSFNEVSGSTVETMGHVAHRQEMGSFDLVYLVNCIETKFYFHADVGAGVNRSHFVALSSYLEWSELRFPDDVTAFLGSSDKTPNAQQLAGGRYMKFLTDGEPQTPEVMLIDGETNSVISRHPERLKSIAEALLAKTCS